MELAGIHEQRFTEYQSYPGRQVEYTIVPRKYQHYFFEGIQSVDATANSDDVQHGQFGFKSDVIIDKDYSNTTGTVSLKEFNNASYVLRGMTGADPSTSFIFDPSRLEHVDVCANLYNKARNKVVRSTWLVDFMPSLSENESLDDIQTRDISYTAVRKIDFEGYQIVHQEWLDPNDQTYGANTAGAQDFILKYPAVIDPVVVRAMIDDTSTDSITAGQVIGEVRHELCPIQFMLRVIVGGEVLDDPTQATVTTTVAGGGTVIQSMLHLTKPLPEDGTPVIAFWLADGNNPHGARAITTAPVMADIDPVPDDDQVTGFEWDPAMTGSGGSLTGGFNSSGSGWAGILRVRWSSPLEYESVTRRLIQDGSSVFSNFSLKVVPVDLETGAAGAAITIGNPAQVGDVAGSSTGTFETSNGTLISRNELLLDFTNNATALSALNTAFVGQPVALEWYLTYQADTTNNLPLKGDASKEVTPIHTIRCRTEGSTNTTDTFATTRRLF